MLNIVTGKEGYPQAVLVRGLENLYGPGKITKFLGIDKSFYGENLVTSKRIYICNNSNPVTYNSGCRIGIDYAEISGKTSPGDLLLKRIKRKSEILKFRHPHLLYFILHVCIKKICIKNLPL